MKTRLTLNETVRESIAIALVRLMEQKPFHKISVSEIVRLAGVGRSSFYRNFGSKEDVLRCYINGLYRASFASGDLICYYDGINEADDFLQPRFGLIERHRHFFTALRRNDLLQFTFDQIEPDLMLCINGLTPPVNKYRITSLSGSCAEVARAWIDSGFKESAAELADIFSPS